MIHASNTIRSENHVFFSLCLEILNSFSPSICILANALKNVFALKKNVFWIIRWSDKRKLQNAWKKNDFRFNFIRYAQAIKKNLNKREVYAICRMGFLVRSHFFDV